MGVSHGSLWLVATPIGTAEDLSPRAREVLERADEVLAEDTRRTRGLLSKWDLRLRGNLRAFHEHNERKQTAGIVRRIEDGAVVALVSDAGTPVLSDPGFVLVRAVREAGLPVMSVPGPSAFSAALAASGLPPLPAVLIGYLPPKGGSRRTLLRRFASVSATLVVLVSPHRLRTELKACSAELGGDRKAALLVELSKVHERAVVGALGELADHPEATDPRGEYVLVVGPPEAGRSDVHPERVRAVYEAALEDGLGRPEAMRRAAREFQVPRRLVFDILERT